MAATRFEHDNYYKYDLREPPRKIIHPDRIKTNKIENLTDNWSDIPFYPNTETKKELIDQYGLQQAEEIIQYSYENSTDPTMPVIPPQIQEQMELNHEVRQQERRKYIGNNTQQYLSQIQKYNEILRQNNSTTRIIPPNINKFSPEYARIIAAKPKATKSVNIRLGGVY